MTPHAAAALVAGSLIAGAAAGAIPDTPADIRVADFAALPQYQGIELSPSGTHIAYRITVENRSMLAVHPLFDTSEPVIIPPYADAEIGWFGWANDGMVAVSYNYSGNRSFFNGAQLRGGRNTEETRFFAFHRDGSNLAKPVHLAMPDLQRGSRSLRQRYESEPLYQDQVIHWLPDDPEHILLNIDSDLDGEAEVREVNVNDGRFRTLLHGVDGVDLWLADTAGAIRYGVGSSRGERRGYFRESDGGPFVDVRDAEWFRREIRPVVFDPEHPTLVYAEGKADPADDTQSVLRLDLRSGEIVDIINRDPNNDSWVLVDRREQRFLGYATRNERVFLDEHRSALQTTLDRVFDGQRVSILTHSPDWRKLVVRVRSDVEAGALYFWDRDTREMAFFGARYPGLVPTLMSEMRAIHYTARDGLEIEAFLTLPKRTATRPLPLVIMPHGGPFGAEGWGFGFMTQMMASRGFAVLQPNFRGSILQGDAFHDAGKKQWGGSMQDDLTDGVLHLVNAGIADPDRVCIVGWSYGGYAALMGTIKTPGLYRCAVSINGVSDLKRLAGRYSFDSEYREFIRDYIGLEGASLSDVSPARNAAKVGVPVLLVHAADDHRAPVEHSDDMARQLRRYDKRVQYERIDYGGGHSLLNGEARLRMVRAVEAFLKEHLYSH